MAIKCALEPAIARMKVNSYLYTNPKITDLDSFYKNMARLLFDVEGDLRHVISDYVVGKQDSNFGSYLPRLVGVIKSQAAALESEFGPGESDFSAILGIYTYTLADNIGIAVLNKIEEEHKAVVTPDLIEKIEDETKFLDGNLKDFFESEGLGKKRDALLLDGELPIERLAELYFADFPDLLTGFEQFFINNFYDNLINTRVKNGATGFNPDMQRVMEDTLAAFEAGVNPNLLASTEINDVLEGSTEAVNAYFAQVASTEFDNLVKIFLTGIKLSKEKGYWEIKEEEVISNTVEEEENQTNEDGEKETIRTGYSTVDGAIHGFDQISPMMKMHIYTTPRLVEDANGNLVQDDKKPHLNDYELKAVANELNALPGTRQAFKEALESIATGATAYKGEVGNILRSFYYKFFSDESYTVNGVERVSLSRLAKDGDIEAENIISAFITDLRSMQNVEHYVVENGRTFRTRTKNAEVASVVKQNYLSSISNPSNKTELNPKIAANVKVIEVTGGFEIMLGDKIKIAYRGNYINSGRGAVVTVDEESFRALTLTVVAESAFKLLGFPPYLTSKFINYYKDHISGFAANTTLDEHALSIPNLIGNFAYMIAANDSDSETRAILEKYGYDIPLSNVSTDENTLPFPPFEFLHAFLEPMTTFAELTEGITAKKMRKNLNGDNVATTAVKSRIYDTNQRAQEERDRVINHKFSVHQDNVLVQGKYSVIDWAAKDGITIGSVKKANSQLTKAEQFKYLLEIYLKEAAANNFTTTAIQPGVMSDRSLIELAVVQASNTGVEFLPKFGNITGSLNGEMTVLERSFIEAEQDRHNALGEAITMKWKQQLTEWVKSTSKWVEFTQESVDAISTVNELDAFLKKYNIPLSKAQSSSILASELMYVGKDAKVNGKKVKVASLKTAFLTMHEIWNDGSEALKFSKSMYRKFRREVLREGFTHEALDEDSMNILQTRYGTNKPERAFDLLLESYFYQTNTISNAMMNLQMGSVYQFPGEMDLEEAENSDYLARIMQRLQIEDNNLTDAEILEIHKKSKRTWALNRSLNSMFVNQAKRNAGLGSGFQHPSLVTTDEEGAFLDEFTNTALISDPEVAIRLLGKLDGSLGQEVYDAAQFGHPLYFLKLNNSLGRNASGFITKGGAVKDISNELDPETGVLRFQKKATFNQFSHEMLRKGTPELNRLFRKMNETITFDGEIKGLDGQTILNKDGLRTGEPVKNLQELWEYFDGIDNENSWVEVLEVLAKNPKNRAAYIEKIGFKSGEKSGNRGFNSDAVWNSDSPKDKLIYTPFSNKYHGVILNADHDPDSTHTDRGEKSLMTQVISAAVFQGETFDIAKNINQALLDLSEASLTRIEEAVYDEAVEILRSRTETNNKKLIDSGLMQTAKDLLNQAALSPDQKQQLDAIIYQEGLGIYSSAMREYTRKLTADAIKQRESFGIVTDLVQSGVEGLDTMQLQNVMHRAVMAELNRATTRVKFKGQEFVVSASYDFVKLYDVTDSAGNVLKQVTRDEYINSKETPWTDISNNAEALNSLVDSDTIKIDGVETKVWKAVREAGSKEKIAGLGTIEAKVLPQGRPLKWIQYTDKDGNNIDSYPEYEALLNNGTELNKALKAKDSVLAKKLMKERQVLENALAEILEDESKGWTTENAEFYMPMMHMKSFNLNKKGSDEPDNIQISDIMGVERSGKKIYLKNGVEVDSAGEGVDMVYESEYKNMVKFFTKRVYLHSDKYPNLRWFRFFKADVTVADILREKESHEKLLTSLEPGSFEYDVIQDELNVFNSIPGLTQIDPTTELGADNIAKLNEVRKGNKKYYINKVAEKQARSFPKTLNMLAARIPAQGKQSYIAGRVKGFITSNRNAIYGAPEMLTVTGADHDVDKSHVLVYSVDSEGAVYDYTNYMVNGKISKAKYKEILNQKLARTSEYLAKKGHSPKEIALKLQKVKAQENHKFSEAIKNYVLDQLMASIRDPRNAIEASTPVSMDKLKQAIKDIENQEVADEEDGEGGVVTGSKNLSSPYNPASIPSLEIINAVGKQAVGVYATGLKGYASVFTAWLNNMESEFIKFGNETERLFGKGDVENRKLLTEVYEDTFGTTDDFYGAFDANSLNIYIEEDGKIKRVSRKVIANTDKWMKGVNPKDPKFREQAQAWEDISELLSAATDNAKELILGRIGADGNTNGLITSALISGFDLSHILKLLQNNKVMEIIEEVADSADTVKSPLKAFMKLDTAIKRYLKEEYGYENSKILAKLGKWKKEIDLLESRGVKSMPLAHEIALGISSVDAMKIKLPTGVNIGNVGLTTTNTENVAPTDVELLEIQQLAKVAGLDFTRLNKVQIGNLLRSMKGAKTIILSDTTQNDEVTDKFVKAYAKYNSVDFYYLGQETWKKFKGNSTSLEVMNGSLPKISETTAVISKGTLSPDSFMMLKEIIDMTKLAVSNPVYYNEKANIKNSADATFLKNKKIKLKNEFEKYISDGPRQLLQFVEMSKENRAITHILSINRGLPNGDWDVFNYFQKFVKAVNSIKPDIFSITIEDVYKFIESVEAGTEFATDLMKKYETVKVGINPFYVLSQNKHYFGYIKSLRFAQNLVRNSTFTNKVIEDVILSKNLTIKEDGYNDIKNFVYGIGIDKFLNDSPAYRELTVAGRKFDLTTNKGRAEFVKAVPTIISDAQVGEFKNNAFIKKLNLDEIKDVKLGDFLTIVKTMNLNDMDASNKAKLRLGLKQLQKQGGEGRRLHDALFFYTMIMNKGSRGKNSFASLFDLSTPAFVDYVEYLKGLDSETIKKSIMSLTDEAFYLSNPNLIPEKSTLEITKYRTVTNSSEDAYYKVPTAKLKGLPVFKSSQTGKVYVWADGTVDGESLGYVVATAKYPLKSIPYSTNSKGLEAAGFQLGETAKINDKGDIGQVLKYDDTQNNYIVLTSESSTPIRMTKEELESFNSDMIFLGRNFGKIPSKDKANKNFNARKSIDDVDFWNLPITGKTQQSEIINGTLKYKVYESVPEGLIPGSTMGIADLGRGRKAKLVYKGLVKLPAKGEKNSRYSNIFMGMGVNIPLNTFESEFKNGKVYGHVVEVVPMFTNNQPKTDLRELHLDLGGSMSNRIITSKAAYFATPRNIRVGEGETVLANLGSKKDLTKAKWFKVTNLGNLRTYAKANGLSQTDVYNLLGYTGSNDHARVAKMMAEDSEENFYITEPYNARVDATNSHSEYIFLGDAVEPNLEDVQVQFVNFGNNTINAEMTATLLKFGVRPEAIYTNPLGLLAPNQKQVLDQVLADQKSINAKFPSTDSEVNRRVVNTIADADMVVVIDDFRHITSKDAEELGIVLEQPLTKEAERLVKSLKYAKVENVIQYLKDMVAAIDNKTLALTESNKYKGIASDNAALKRIATDALRSLETESTLPPELKFTNFNAFVPAQAAKYLGKPLHIYSPSRQQWYKYDGLTGQYEETAIPVMEGSTAIFNPKGKEELSKQGLDSLLKKTSAFKAQQQSGLGKLRSINEIGFASLEITEEINEVDDVPSPLDNVTGIKKVTREDFDKTVNSGLEDGTVVRAVEIDGELYKESDFTEFENTEVKRLKDGSITIESKTSYGRTFFWAYFPDPKLRAKYADYTGETVKQDFKIKIDGEYYVFSELHGTDKDAFLRRDLLIEEKKELKAMFAEAQAIYDQEVAPLYKAIRFENLESVDKYKHYSGYNAFMLHLNNGLLDIDAKHTKTAIELQKAHKAYKQKHDEAWERYREIRSAYTKAIPKVTGIEGSFFDKTANENDVLVYLTDNTGNDNKVDKRIKVSPAKGFSIPVFYQDNTGRKESYKLNKKDYVRKSVSRLFDVARNNPEKTYYIEMSAKPGEAFYGEVTGIQAVKALADAISQERVKGIPANVKFTNGGENGTHIINQYRGGLDPSKINTARPFDVTRDATRKNTFDISYYNLWNQYIDESSLFSQWNLERGYAEESEIKVTQEPRKGSPAYGRKYEAYKNLWRRWAEANPEKFEQLAMMVGGKTIYDPYHSEETGFSTGKVLAELLTERFVDNSWIDYPQISYNTNLQPDQVLLPLSAADFSTMKFNKQGKGGKATLNTNGKAYIATVEEVSVKPGATMSLSTLNQLGLGDSENALQDFDKKYPFTVNESYAVVRLQEFKGELKKAEPVAKGTFSDIFAASDIEVSEEHMKLAEKATVAYGIDTRAKISDTLDGSITGTPWIREYKGAIGDGIVTELTEDDSVWIYGSRLEDGNNPETISGVTQSTKILIDKTLAAGADILVGKGSGVEEEVRAYIMATAMDYVPTADGFSRNKEFTPDMKADIQVWKPGPAVRRFNGNNVLEREGSNLTGAWGTIMNSTVNEGGEAYRLTLEESEVKNWEASISSDEVINMMNKLGISEGESSFGAVRGVLVAKEQNFARRAIAGAVLVEQGKTSKFYNIADFDAYLENTLENDAEFAGRFRELEEKVFNTDGTFKFSDVAALAMARNRNITIGYIKETLPELFENNFEAHPYFELFNKERKETDRGSDYYKMLNEETLDRKTLQLITESTEVTFRDAYNLLKTLGADKIIAKNGNIGGQLVNKLFAEQGVKAFKHGEKYIVLDNDAIWSPARFKPTYDTAKGNNYQIEEVENELARYNPKVYRYMKNKGILKIDPYTKEVRVLVNDSIRVYNADKTGYREMIADLQFEIANNYFAKLKGVNVDEEILRTMLKSTDTAYSKIKFLVSDHMKYNKPLRGDNFNLLFGKTASEELSSNKQELQLGGVYTLNDKKVIAMQDADGWFAQAQDGKLYRLKGGAWDVVPGINNREESYLSSKNNAIATPKGVGEVYDSLITTDNEQVYGDFEVSEKVSQDETIIEKEITATNHETGEKYRWESFANAWAPIDRPAMLGSESNVDQTVVTGQKVIALPTPAGNILLSNGTAVNSETVKDDKGTYKLQNGIWTQTEFKGGFKNPSVKFQKGDITYTDNEGRVKASRRVSTATMRSVFNTLFKGLNIEAELLSSMDIEAEYGVKYAESNGFVIDGKVIINVDKATLDTPLHELGGHIYMANLRTEDPVAYQVVIEKALEHDIAEEVAKRYPELGREDLGEEIFSTLFGIENQNKLTEQPLSKWKKILKLANDAVNILDFFKKAFDVVFGNDTHDYELNLDDSLITIINKLGDNIVFGDKSVLSTLSDLQKGDLNKVMNPDLTLGEIEAKLTDLGYIKTVCI